jgi:hypothetical protein
MRRLVRFTARQINAATRIASPSTTAASPVRNGGRSHSGVGGPPHTGAPGPHPVPNCAVTVGQTSMSWYAANPIPKPTNATPTKNRTQ